LATFCVLTCGRSQKEENEATQEEIFQERQYQIDAAIVRTMKTRKSLNYQVLLSELFSQLKFPAKVSGLGGGRAPTLDPTAG
jgi:cullin-4